MLGGRTRTGTDAGRLRGRLLASLCCLLAAAALANAAAAGATTAPSAAGTWSCCGAGGAGEQTWTITESSGTLSGSGPGIGPIHGSISGTSVTIVTGPYTSDPGYEATFVGTISGETMSGTWKSNASQEGTWTATRTSGSPTVKTKQEEEQEATEVAAKKKKEEEEKNGKRPTGTSVVCNYEFATSDNTCVASVGDGGPQPPTVTPTGTVTFTTTSGGFTNGATCTLVATPLSPQVASCSLIYETAFSGLPSITATYNGDSRHAGSVGHTQFLGANPDETTVQELPGPPGQYPNELQLELQIPANGTEVDGAVQAVDPDPSPVPMTLPKVEAGLDSESAGDLQLTEKLGTEVNDSGAQNPTTIQALGASVGTLAARIGELAASGNTTEQAEAQNLQDQADQAVQAIDKMLKEQVQLQKQIIQNMGTGSALSSSRHKTAKKHKTKVVKPLAYVTKANVGAGPFKLSLHLNRAALNKLAGKRSSVVVYLRVDMILPSRIFKAGVPRSIVERITLKRTPAAKGHPHAKH
jgi:hypothetical protein